MLEALCKYRFGTYPSCRRGSEGWRVSSETFGVEMYTLRGSSGGIVGVHKRPSCKSLVTGARISTKHIAIHAAQMLPLYSEINCGWLARLCRKTHRTTRP